MGLNAKQIADGIIRGIAPQIAELQARVDALERAAGVRAKAAIYPAGIVVTFGANGRWVHRGAGRWRKLEDS